MVNWDSAEVIIIFKRGKCEFQIHVIKCLSTVPKDSPYQPNASSDQWPTSTASSYPTLYALKQQVAREGRL